MSKSISVSKGKGSMRHNNRTIITDNVDPTRTHLNTYYKQEPLKEAYEKCFGAAIEEYNDKQKRADRKIDGVKGYMDKIRNSGNGEKLFYETIVQIGNQYDSHVSTADGELCQQLLDEYMRGFEKRNPNLYVFNAVLHVDEQTPHLHIDYIPVADGYKQGQMVRNSLDRALKQQGIDGKANKAENRTIAWENREKDHIEKLMRERGLERSPDTGLNREHKSIHNYRSTVADIENRVNAVELNVTARPNKLNKDEVIITKKDFENLVERAKLSTVHKKASQQLQQELAAKVEDFTQYARNQKNQIEMMKREAAEDRRTASLNKQWSELSKEHYRNLYNQQLDLNKEYDNVVKENTSLKAEISDFERSFEERVTAAVRGVQEPLETKISSLKAKVEEQATQIASLNSIIGNLKNRLRGAYESVKSVVQAVGMLKYDKTDGYKVDGLSKKQDRLIDAVAEYGAMWAREDGFEDLAEAMEKRVGLSKGIQKIVEPQQKEKGKGENSDHGSR